MQNVQSPPRRTEATRWRTSAGETLIKKSSDTVVVRGSQVPQSSTEQLRLPTGFRRSKEGQPLERADLDAIASWLTPARQVDPRLGKLDPLTQAKELEKSVEHARLLMRNHELGTLGWLWAKGKELYQRILGLPAPAQPPSRSEIQQAISRQVSALKEHHERELKPIVDAVRKKFQGRTFVPGGDTPAVLSLAAVPKAKLGKVISMEALVSGVTALVRNYRVDYVTLAKDLGPDRVAISRLNSMGVKESLEFSFRRPGKVDVVLNGKVVGNLWNDDAMKAAELFAQGRGFAMQRKKAEVYVVA